LKEVGLPVLVAEGFEVAGLLDGDLEGSFEEKLGLIDRKTGLSEGFLEGEVLGLKVGALVTAFEGTTEGLVVEGMLGVRDKSTDGTLEN
jgi:hypothetical protein